MTLYQTMKQAFQVLDFLLQKNKSLDYFLRDCLNNSQLFISIVYSYNGSQ